MFHKAAAGLVLVMGLNVGLNADSGEDGLRNNGLVGIELGYVGAEYNRATGGTDSFGNPSVETKSVGAFAAGLKLGGEREHYRLFLEGRYWNTDEFNHAATAGGAFQLIFRPGDNVGIFGGVNAGVVNSIKHEWDPYIGLDAGVSFDLDQRFAIEVGGRYSKVNVEEKEAGKINELYQGYVTAVYKYSGE